MLHRFIYNLGVAFKNPSLKKHYKFLLDTDKWTLEQLKHYQFKKLKEFLIFAYEHTSFYKEEFDCVGFNPYQFESFDEYKRIPIIDKSVLLKNNDKVHSDYHFDRLIQSETSGTSGAP